MTIPYTYHIAWTKHNLHYYGVRYASGCNPKDLWVEYPTSSKKVPFIREQYGEPDVIEVRKTFNEPEKAINWEHRVLKRLDVVRRDNWINECCFPARDNRGRVCSTSTRQKISAANKGHKGSIGYKHTLEAKKKMSEARKGKKRPQWVVDKIANSLRGKTRTQETKDHLSKIKTGIPCLESTKQKISQTKLGIPKSKETKHKMSISKKKYWQRIHNNVS